MCLRPVHDISGLPVQVASMQGIAEKYRVTTEENRRLYNEVQDLKGNIRVFCRVRPPGATGDGSACKETSCLMGALRFSDDCALALLSVRALVMLRTHGCGCLGTGMPCSFSIKTSKESYAPMLRGMSCAYRPTVSAYPCLMRQPS